MSPHVHERLRDLETEVRDLRFLPAAAVRARGRSRARRQWAAGLTAGAAVAVTAGAAFAWPQPHAAPAGAGPAAPVVTCRIALPNDPAEIRIRVLGTGRAAAVTQLRQRGFTVLNDAKAQDPVPADGLLYGPSAIGAAAIMQAELKGAVAARFDPTRRDEAIDLVAGARFAGFASPTEINQKLAAAGAPTAPPQCTTVVR
jgi:hypothetical protein